MKRLIFFISFLQISVSVLNAQSSEKQLNKADEYASNGRYHLAIPIYTEILKFDPANARANYGLGSCYLEVVDKRIAYKYLQKAFEANPKLPNIELNLAGAYQYADLFKEAMDSYKKVLARTDQLKEREKYNYITKKITECETGIEYMAAPVNARIENLGPVINSKYHDYAPVLSLDETKLVFTSRRIGSSENHMTEDGDYYEDIYISTKQDGKWKEPVNLGKKVNTANHDAAISISPDGSKVFIYKDDNGGDIFVTDFTGKEWTTPVPFSKKINTKYNESSITMTPDGKVIYFTSDKPDGFGGKDIYMSTLDEKNNWTNPTNLGPAINTPYDDDAPFIHQDGLTLYFSSKGHKNMGGYDIFRSEFLNGKWTNPENLGYPINSSDDDIYFMISFDNKRGYCSSVKEGGYGESDIYIISMPQPEELKKFQPVMPVNLPISKSYDHLITASITKTESPFTIFRGKVFDEATKAPLTATINIIDSETLSMVAEATSNAEGEFEIALLSGNDYAVSVGKESFLFYSDNIQIPYSSDYQLLLKDIYLQKIRIGSKVVLKNIFFETGKSTLRLNSTAELDKLYALLTENAKLKVEIAGHTDNQGSADLNKKLSAGRAKAVADFLVKKGIAPERLKFAGYGKDRPVADNDTETGRQLNRRTEFEIIGN